MVWSSQNHSIFFFLINTRCYIFLSVVTWPICLIENINQNFEKKTGSGGAGFWSIVIIIGTKRTCKSQWKKCPIVHIQDLICFEGKNRPDNFFSCLNLARHSPINVKKGGSWFMGFFFSFVCFKAKIGPNRNFCTSTGYRFKEAQHCNSDCVKAIARCDRCSPEGAKHYIY